MVQEAQRGGGQDREPVTPNVTLESNLKHYCCCSSLTTLQRHLSGP